MWWMRETLPECNHRVGSVSSHDIALSLSDLDRFVGEARARVERLGHGFRINCFGHAGDGNLHFNVFPPAGQRAVDWRHMAAEVKGAIHDLVHDFGGSIRITSYNVCYTKLLRACGPSA